MHTTTNLFDYFEQPVRDGAGYAPWAARAPRRPSPHFDLMLVPRSRSWLRDPDSLDVLEQVEHEPWVDTVIRHSDQVNVRVADHWIETVGAALEAGGGAEAALADLARAQ